MNVSSFAHADIHPFESYANFSDIFQLNISIEQSQTNNAQFADFQFVDGVQLRDHRVDETLIFNFNNPSEGF